VDRRAFLGTVAGSLLAASLAEAQQPGTVYRVRILGGWWPDELQPEFELVISLKTATALGLTIPQSLLRRADQVIE
jgi:ABC-type uncharacterized transport system substrate-binding protein